MKEIEYFRRMFAYTHWANGETLASVAAIPESPPRAAALMAHLAAAEELWLDRLYGRPTTTPVWPELSFAECDAAFEKLAREWRLFLDACEPDQLSAGVPYTNTLGESFVSSIRDILTHVLTHGNYHRGQVANLVAAAGGSAAYTDFIHWTRKARE